MRVFHFVNEEYGLEDLRKRRLKVATLNELNDPFEFFGVDLGDEGLRRAFRVMKDELGVDKGLLCFSRSWYNPVLWSHYAAKHTGLCLGFDIPDELLGRVTYSRKRLRVEPEVFSHPRHEAPETLIRFFFTKYAHWRYENEVRCFVNLEEKDPQSDLYFAEFAENLRLATVIVGAQSSVTRETLRTALGELAPVVEVLKARLAFRSFRVVRQRKSQLWV